MESSPTLLRTDPGVVFRGLPTSLLIPLVQFLFKIYLLYHLVAMCLHKLPPNHISHVPHQLASSCKVVLTSPLAQGKAPEYLEVQDAPPSLTGAPSARPNISSQSPAKYLRVFHVCPWSWERSSTIAAGRGERNTRIRWVKRNSVSRSSWSVSSFTPSADCHQVSG